MYTGRVKSRVVVALLALSAALLPAPIVLAEDPVATLSLIRPKPAKEAPDFEARTPDDRPIRLADFRGKVIFLNFWATWCDPCREEMPSMERLHRKYKDRGLVVLAVSLDSQGGRVVKPFLKKMGLTFPVALDPKMTVRERYGVVFQGGALFDSMSVADNMAFPLRERSRLGAAEIRSRVSAARTRSGRT